jgi:nitroreductase
MDAVHEGKIRKILTAAVAAPSGDNSQPWRFVFRTPDTIEFYAIPEKDNALLNIDESGTFIALGAAIQNAELEAKALGFSPEIRFGGEGAPVATLVLRDEAAPSDLEQTLEQAILLRHTNRKAYKNSPLADGDRQALINAAGEVEGARLSLLEGKEDMASVARALTTMEEVALQNKSLHKLFFESIFWSKEQNTAGKPGLYIKTLELPPPAQLLFKVLRYWPVATVLAKIGFPKVVAATNAKQNASASAFGVITLSRFDRLHYIEAGRLLERVWLMAAARGMSLQIVTGLLFLARTVARGDSPLFSVEERALVKSAYVRIREQMSSNEPFLMFRVGYAEAPSAVSFRKPPVVTSTR